MRSRGKKMTSRMEGASVRSITRRSMPIPFTGCGRHPEFEGMEEVLIESEDHVRLIAPLPKLLEETLPLIDRIVQFGKTVGDFPSRNEKLKPVHHIGSSAFRRERGRYPWGNE